MGSGRTDWQPSAGYGGTQTLVFAGTTGSLRNVILDSTQIAFFEDDLLLLRLIGHCKVSLIAGMGTSAVNVVQRLRLGIEDQAAGTYSNAGANLNDSAVAEDGFLAEKRFRLQSGSPDGEFGDNRNDTVRNHPWFSNWDVKVKRKLEIPWFLELWTYVSSATAGDTVSVLEYFRALVRK